MEHIPFIEDFPSYKLSFYRGVSIAMFDYQRVIPMEWHHLLDTLLWKISVPKSYLINMTIIIFPQNLHDMVILDHFSGYPHFQTRQRAAAGVSS